MWYQIIIALLVLWNFKAARDLFKFICWCLLFILFIIAVFTYKCLTKILELSYNLIIIFISAITYPCFWLYFYFNNQRPPNNYDIQEFFGNDNCVYEIKVLQRPKRIIYLSKPKNQKSICKIEEIPKPKLCLLPPKSDNKKNDNVKCPIITFFHNTSLISIFNEFNGKYEALEGWNGINGKPLFISFYQKKPKYCEEAAKIYQTKPSFVVYDLIYIMSFPPEKLKPKPEWGFKITKDSENPILLEFDNYDGTRKAAAPEFLMAMLLKQHLKVIASITGEKPKQISYTFTELGKQKCKRVNPAIREACKLINVEVVDFKKI